MEASSNGTSLAGNEEELSSQMSSFNEAMTQIRELEERALEELREITQQGPSWLELSEVTDQPDCDLETFVNKPESALTQQAKQAVSTSQASEKSSWPAPSHATGRIG